MATPTPALPLAFHAIPRHNIGNDSPDRQQYSLVQNAKVAFLKVTLGKPVQVPPSNPVFLTFWAGGDASAFSISGFTFLATPVGNLDGVKFTVTAYPIGGPVDAWRYLDVEGCVLT
jgi:hypothetical protein